MSDETVDGLVPVDVLRSLLSEILEVEKAKMDLLEDQSALKLELGSALTDKKLVKPCMDIAFGKFYKSEVSDRYRLVSNLLGLPAMSEYYMPSDTQDEQTLDLRKRLNSIIERYRNLEQEKSIYSTNLRDLYAKAKAKGISVPCLKKVVDFCLHPAKLEKYRTNNPLLEAYMDNTSDLI